MTIASPTLPANLLALTDSDFESGVGSWALVTNASSVTTSAAWAFTGSNSLQWTATASGTTQVGTKVYSATVGLPYVASGVINPGVSRSVQLLLRWFNGSSFVSQQISVAVTANGPTPFSVSGVCPVGCNGVQVSARISSAAASETERLDFMFLAQTDTQVLVDWANSPFGASSQAGQAFTDLTPLVRLDAGISCGRGRQDAVSEVQAGFASFTAHNTEGWFTAKDNASPWYGNVKLGRRLQINMADETGTWHTRFDGPLSEIDYVIDPTGEAVAQIQGADVLAFMARENDLNCWTVETVLADGPALHWTLDDPAGSVTAAETSGNSGPALRARYYAQGSQFAGLTFASGQGGVETQADAPSGTALGLFSSPLQSPYWTTAVVTGSNRPPSVNLSAQLPSYLNCGTGPGWSIETWAILDPTAFGSGGVLSPSASPLFLGTTLSLGDTASGHNLCVVADSSSGGGNAVWSVFTNQYPISLGGVSRGGYTSAASSSSFKMPTNGIPIHVALVCNGNSTGTLYINGAASVTLTSDIFTANYRYNWLDVGGAFQGLNGWQGNISVVSQYNYALTSGQVTAHYNAGRYGALSVSYTCRRSAARVVRFDSVFLVEPRERFGSDDDRVCGSVATGRFGEPSTV